MCLQDTFFPSEAAQRTLIEDWLCWETELYHGCGWKQHETDDVHPETFKGT